MKLINVDSIGAAKFLSEDYDPSESDSEANYRKGWNDAIDAIKDFSPIVELPNNLREIIDELRTYITEPNISDDESTIEGYNQGLETAISVISNFKSLQNTSENPKKVQVATYGWICPVCGRGLSPITSVCPCLNGKGWEVTC